MNFESYKIQVLVAIARGCRPNSPKPRRTWTQVRPLYGVPEYGDALAALCRDGLLLRAYGLSVKPSAMGYRIIELWKAQRREMKRRPVLFDRCMWDQPIEIEIRRAT